MRRRGVFVFLLFLLVVAGVLYVYNPSVTQWAPKCVMLKLTGFRCPGCGIQRFIHQMLHGNFAEAVKYNYFAVLVLPYFAVLLFRELMPDGSFKATLGKWFVNRYWATAYVALYFTWWVVRNVYDL